MTFLKSTLAVLSVFGMFSIAGPANAQQAANAPTGAGSWQTMSIDGATVRFEMPKPIKMNQDPQNGMVVYAHNNPARKTSMKVGIVKRDFQKDQSQGLSDDKVLDNFALRVLAGNKLSFKKMGFSTNYQFGGNLKLATGVGKQYNTQVGKAQVLNRFYINKQGLYYVEATTQNTSDPEINRFLKSFRP